MYNGIGLTTPRGSGTNGHVQRNWAFVRPGKKENSNYRSEEDMKKLDASLNRPPNKDILDHDRKRKIEVKCLEFEEILEKQGLSPDEIKTKVESYRNKLMGQGKSDIPKDEFGRITVRDSHQIAEAQQEKNAKLREAFNISEYFIEGSSFDSDRKVKEDLAKNLALQKELDIQREQTAAAAAKEKGPSKRYALDRTPSMEHDMSSGGVGGVTADNGNSTIKKKKKKKTRESSASPERKKDKKKKSKKRKKESKSKKSKKLRKRKNNDSDSNDDNEKESFYDDSDSEIEADLKKSRKKPRRDKKKRRNKKKERSSSSDKSRSTSLVEKSIEFKKSQNFVGKESSNYDYLSRSNEKSYKPKDSQKTYYESSQYSRGRRSRSRKDRNKSNMRSKSRDDKSLSNRRSSSYVGKNDRHCDDLRYYTQSGDDRSPENNDGIYYNKDHNNRRSGSCQISKHGITNERVKTMKRKRYEQYSHESPSMDKRKRYSRSHSSSNNNTQNHDGKRYSKVTKIESNSSRARSRTPNHKSLYNQKKLKCRSRTSSVKEHLRNKSHTPPPQTSKDVEVKKIDTYICSNQQKFPISKPSSLNFIDKKSPSKKLRSRKTSTSSNTTSSTDTESYKSRTPSPKKDHINKTKEQIKLTSPMRTPTVAKRISRSKSSIVLNEKNRKRNQRSDSISIECIEKSKEKREHSNSLSRTPPPRKVEKKTLSPKSSRDSSELSYSPAIRNPERYSDILENDKFEKNKIGDKENRKDIAKSLKKSEECELDRKEKLGKFDGNQLKPVVHLQSQSDEDSDATERNTEKLLDEYQEFKRERELKDLKMLEQLKTGIAAKAKEKIKSIEKMAASTSTNSSSNKDGEVSDKFYKCTVRNSLNDFLAANNVAPAMLPTCSPTPYNSTQNSKTGAIYPQTLEEIKKEQESILQLSENSNYIVENKNSNKDNENQATFNKSLVTSSCHALSQTPSPLSNINVIIKEGDRKRERDFRERERERETNNFNKDRFLERKQKSSPNIYGNGGGGITGGTIGGGRRNINNNSMINLNHRQQRLNLICNSGGVGGHHHPHTHLHLHHHHPNHKIINNHHSSASSSSNIYVANNSTNPHTLICNHANNLTNVSFSRPSRINNTPLITATQFNNQMLSKQSNSILVNRRDHRTALNLGLSGTPCTNFSNSNLLLTKANNNQLHLHAAAVGHIVGGGHHHQHHHHHHHSQSASMSSAGINPATQITDRILMAASIAAAQRHSLGVHNAASSVAAVAAANNLNFLQQQNKSKLVIKPFKINDSQPLVAALADSSLVDAIVSKVSTATVAAAESAARRSRSRSRRSRSRNRHVEKEGSGGSNSGEGGGERNGNRRRSTSNSRSSRSSAYSRSRSRSHSHRSSRSHSSQSSSSSHTSSRSSSSSSFSSSRSGTRSPSIPRRRGSPSFLDRRRITSARKRPIPYHRKLPSDVSSCYCSSCCSRDSSIRSRSPSRDSRSPSRFF